MIFRLLLAVSLAIPFLSAQTLEQTHEITVSSAPYTPRLPTAIKVDATLVEAAVVVRNGKGDAVPGLPREDFEIRDEGKKRDIRAFSVETSQRAAAPPIASSTPAPASAAPSSPARNRWIGLLFDDLNSNASQLMSARAAALRFLKEGFEPGDHVTVFTTWGRQMVPFTTDTAAIAAALNKLSPHPQKADVSGCPSLTAYEAYLIANRIDSDVLDVKVEEARRCSGQPPPARSRRGGAGGGSKPGDPIVQQVIQLSNSVWEQTLATSRNTFGAIHDIVDYLAQFRGRRLLVCASGGFLSANLETEQSDLIDRALHAGVVIDSLDAKGLYVQEAPQMGMGASARSVTMQQNLGTRPQESANDALASLAYGSGGLFFHNNNDLTAGLREMMAPQITYLLGFAPDSAPNGKFHKLKVRVSPGHYDVQARPGYIAAPIVPTADLAPRKIDEAVLSSATLTGAPASIGSTIETAADGSKRFAAVLHLDLAHMAFREAFGIRNQRVTFIAVLSDPHGNFVTGTEYTIDFALQQATFEKYSGGFNAGVVLKAPPGKYRLRGAVDLAGAISATTLDIEIP